MTIGLFGSDAHDELKSERDTLIQKRNEEREIQRKEQERLRKIDEEKANLEQEKRKRQKEIEDRKQKIEEEEFELLVAEMQSKGFTMSAQVSHYIIKNRLGDKYQNISGVLEMVNGISSWKFNGGFPPKIYAKLCERLKLDNKGTDSRVIGFTSFKDLKQ